MKNKSEKQFYHGVRTGFLSATIPHCQSTLHNLVVKGLTTVLLSQMDLSRSVCHFYQCFRCLIFFFYFFVFSIFGKYLSCNCRLRNTELQIHEIASQVKKFSAFLCMERCKLGLINIYLVFTSAIWACNPAFSEFPEG